MDEHIINEANLCTNEEGDVDLKIHGNVNIAAGSNVSPTTTRETGSRDGYVATKGHAADFDAKSADKGDDKYLQQGARPKQVKLQDVSHPTQSIDSQEMSISTHQGIRNSRHDVEVTNDMERHVINEANLVRNEGEGDVNLTIHGNVIIAAGGNADDKYLRQGARPKPTKQQEVSDPTQSMESQEISKKVAELCDVVNTNTMQMTEVNIIENFGKEKLIEPDFEVYPQMRRVKNYFGGGFEKWEDSKIKIGKTRFLRRLKKKVIKNQMRREMGFYFRESSGEDEEISVERLVASITKQKDLRTGEKKPVTAIVASAGSGKTTLLKRIARDCVHRCSAGEQDENSQNTLRSKPNFKMVRYMEMKNMKYEKDTHVSAVIFGGLYESEDDEKKAYKWLLDYQSEAILYLDGLDQATWSIPKSKQRKLGPFEKSDTANIIYNLLSRNLLPHLKIMIASREFKISELPADARPDDIVSLVGLTKRDAERLFVSLIGDRGAEMWEKIQKMARRLVNLVSIPVFLVLTAAVLAMDPDRPPPVTITELYNRIIQNLNQVENTTERDQIMNAIRKLKAMAHQGMLEGRVVFYESDLKKFGLSIQDVRDLMIKVPGNNLLSRYLFEGDFVFFFCHQSLQEFLSGSFVTEMKFGKFSRFNKKHLHESRWSVVRTFVSGIIHGDSASPLHQGMKTT